MTHSGFVSVVGRPNVGKSTLINRLVGQKISIVTPKPQTTRNRILAVANFPGGQIVFFDTPGIHQPQHQMNRFMVEAAVGSLSRVELVALMLDAAQPSGRGDELVLEVVKKVKAPVFLLLNKVDKVSKESILPLIDQWRGRHPFAEIVPLSALTGDNVDRLVALLLQYLPEGPPLYPQDTLTDLPEKFFAAEMVREKILLFTREEIPYATAVRVDAWEDKPRLTRIEASILVERDSQKGILIGKQGEMLRRIGTAARQELERFLGSRVFLGLHVKVRENWREDRRLLRELGIEPPRD
jgi:GTP-binding protein Era